MKTKVMMISIAVGILLFCTDNVQAQSRVVRRARTERRVRNERPNDRRPEAVVAPVPAKPVRKRVDPDAIRAIERESFDSNRLKMTHMIISTGGLLSTSQIYTISKAFDFDSNRVKFLTMAYPNCIDKASYYRVLETLDFSSSKEKITEFVIDFKHDKPDMEPLAAISSHDLNDIVKVLKHESFDSTRKKLGMMITCGCVLTSRQIAAMAKTFDFDSNRYDFLLFAYRNCVDPQNYAIAAGTLQFSSSRSELMRKISR